MAYFKAVQVENTLNGQAGKWAVGKGKKYYLTAVFDTETEAKREAIIWNMQELYSKAQELYDQGVEDGLLEENCTFGDYLC